MKDSERDFQRWLIKDWKQHGRWAENVHPSVGMKSGFPDVVLLIESLLLPVELKTCELGEDKNGEQFIEISDVRPSQRRWSIGYSAVGGKSFFIAGLKNPEKDEWIPHILPNQAVWKGQKRFDLDEVLAHISTTHLIAMGLSQSLGLSFL